MRSYLLALVFSGLVICDSAGGAEPVPTLLETGLLTSTPDDGASAVFQTSSVIGDIPAGSRLEAQYLADLAAARVRFCIKSLRRPPDMPSRAPGKSCLGYVTDRDGRIGLPASRKGDALVIAQGTPALIILEKTGH